MRFANSISRPKRVLVALAACLLILAAMMLFKPNHLHFRGRTVFCGIAIQSVLSSDPFPVGDPRHEESVTCIDHNARLFVLGLAFGLMGTLGLTVALKKRAPSPGR